MLFHSPRIVTDGLVLYLDAANGRSYPGSGTTWSDLSGNGNNGSMINGPTYSGDNLGGIICDGVDDYINISNPQNLNPGANSFSINCWLKQNDTGYNGIVEARGNGLHGFLFILNYGGAGKASLFLNTTSDSSQNVYFSSISTFGNTTNFMNVCVSVDRNLEIINFYLNGEKQGNSINIISGGTIDPAGGYKYWVGGDLGGPESNSSFYIVQHYNRALSPEEIKQNYNATRGRFGL